MAVVNMLLNYGVAGGISGWQQGDSARKVEVERKCARKNK